MADRRTAAAKRLRSQMTDTERRLWTQLRAHRMGHTKFRRQQPIGPYIVDFVCFESRLVIEVDGGQHQDSEPDTVRDAWLRAQGFRVLRFWDNDVLTNLPGVLERISEVVSPSPPPPLHAPRAALHCRPAARAWSGAPGIPRSPHEGRGE